MIRSGQEEMDIEPPVSPDTDLRDFQFMPLDVRRLRDSDLAAYATAEEFRAAVLLWCAAWHQVPASSLPDDDRVLAHLAGFGRDVDGWMKVREGALRHFKKAFDGRLYHSVIAEKASEAWSEKLSYRDRKARRADIAKRAAGARWEKTAGSEGSDADDMRDAVHQESMGQCMNDASCIDDAMLKGTGTGTGTGTNTSLSPPPAAEEASEGPGLKYTAEFEAWWAAYPRKSGKVAAFEAYKRAKKKIGPGAPEKLASAVASLSKAMAGKEERFIPHPTTWLNQGRWDDEPFKPTPGLLPHMVGRNRFGVGG